MIDVKHLNNETRGEFVAMIDNKQAGLMTYTWAGETRFIIDHTEVDPAYGGKGVGKEMVFKAVEFARKKDIKILPLCPFAKATFEKFPEIQDVL